MERDLKDIDLASLPQISTHTLTWSVTRSFSALTLGVKISTHTLTWSVTYPNR